MNDKFNWKAMKAKRTAALNAMEMLRQSEQTVVKMAAQYLSEAEATAFLDQLKDFEAVSQLASPFAQAIGNVIATVENFRGQIIAAERMIDEEAERQKIAAEAAKAAAQDMVPVDQLPPVMQPAVPAVPITPMPAPEVPTMIPGVPAIPIKPK